MASSRAERMAMRMRGAGRHQIEDISFNFVLPDDSSILDAPAPGPSAAAQQPPLPPPSLSPPTATAAAPRTANPNTSAKRRRIESTSPNTSRTPVAPPPLPATRSSGRRPDPYDLANVPEATRPRTSPRSARSITAGHALRRSIVSRTPAAEEEGEEDELESLPRPTPRSARRGGGGVVTTREEMIEIVQESPADAPGSGQRKRVVKVSEVATSAGAALQQVMQGQGHSQKRKTPRSRVVVEDVEEEDELTGEVDVSPVAVVSSPLVRRAERSKEKKRSGRKRKVPQETEEEEDEITASADVSEQAASSSPTTRRKAARNAGGKTAAQQQENAAPTRRTARRSGAGAAAFGLDEDEVDELSPAPVRTASPSTGPKRSVRLSEASIDDGVDELSPAVAQTARRSVRPLAKAMVEKDGVDELSPAPAKAVKSSAKLSRKRAAAAVDASTPAQTGRRTVRSRAVAAAEEDDVDELSPAPARAAKRSGKPAPKSAAPEADATPILARSTRRGRTLLDDTGADELDEPSPAPTSSARRSVRLSDVSATTGDADELSPEKTREVMGPPPKPKPQKEVAKGKGQAKQPEKAAAKPAPKSRKTRQPEPPAAEEPVEEPEVFEEAEEIDATEAARRLGRKRPRRSLQAPAEETEEDRTQEDGDEDEEEPAAKRRRKKPLQSPAKQQPPKTRKEKKNQTAAAASSASQRAAAPKPQQPPAKKRKSTKSTATEEDASQAQAKGGFPITVQRFTRLPAAAAAADHSDNEPDPLTTTSTIPFSSRAGVNTIDVLSQICDELVTKLLSNLQQQGRAAPAEDAARRREVKVMTRTLEAFRQELSTRLLEHTIALDTLHGLRKRVRQAQRDRVGLREEILGLRRERELVEVRKDAVRARHEGAREVALANIGLSSTMHDIDLAVEKGVSAEPLSAAEQSQAELANLEFLIGQVAGQACSESDQGGNLKQIRDFNAFLERAAAALEGR